MNLPPAFSRIVPEGFTFTPPVILLIVSNLVVIALAIFEGWDFTTVMFLYWIQSLIIGLFTMIRLLFADTALIAEELAAEQTRTGEGDVRDTGRLRIWGMKIGVSGFFCIHYGLFNLFFFIMFIGSGSFGILDPAQPVTWAPIVIFFFNHLFSTLYYWKRERKGGIFMANSILLPYIRIIPMFLTLLIGGFITGLFQLAGFTTLLPMLVVFLALKAYMDIRMHIVTHGMEARGESLMKFFDL